MCREMPLPDLVWEGLAVLSKGPKPPNTTQVLKHDTLPGAATIPLHPSVPQRGTAQK